MSQWGFYFNQNRCVGCKACVLACKNWNEHRRGDFSINICDEELFKENPNYYQPVEGENAASQEPSFSYVDATGATNFTESRRYYMKENWRRLTTHDTGRVALTDEGFFENTFERAYLSLGCNHCSDPECIKACPMGVYYKEDKYGLTLYNNSVCISCGRCKDACPWDAPQFYRPDYSSFSLTDPNRPHMTKCTGCYDRLQEGKRPACVAACWHRALDFGEMDILKEKYNNNFITELPQFKTNGTKPMIIFREKN